jgi:hypothetical protein
VTAFYISGGGTKEPVGLDAADCFFSLLIFYNVTALDSGFGGQHC